MSKFCDHGFAVRHTNVILASTKQSFTIAPGSAYKGRPGCQCLKHANGRHTTQTVRIKLTWHMQTDLAAGVYVWRAQIGKVSAVLDTGAREPVARVFWVPHAVYHKFVIAQS